MSDGDDTVQFWVLYLTRFAEGFGFVTLLTLLPTYINALDPQLWAYRRTLGIERALVVLNWSDEPTTYAPPAPVATSVATLLLDSRESPPNAATLLMCDPTRRGCTSYRTASRSAPQFGASHGYGRLRHTHNLAWNRRARRALSLVR